MNGTPLDQWLLDWIQDSTDYLKASSEGDATMTTSPQPETWRTEAAEKIEKRLLDVIQEQTESAGDNMEWLRTAAMKEQPGLAEQYARRIRDAMNAILSSAARLDAIREMRDVYEITFTEAPAAEGLTGAERRYHDMEG